MEFFIWGLLSLVPQAIAYSLRRTDYSQFMAIVGFFGFPIALSIAAGRAAQSIKVAVDAFFYWFATFPVICGLSSVFQIDTRWVPITTFLLPPVYGLRNPAHGDSEFNLVAAVVCYAIASGIAIRISFRKTVSIEKQFIAVVTSGIAMASLLTLHLYLLSRMRYFDYEKDRIWIVASMYCIMFAFGTYFVLLFYDFHAGSTTSPTQPKTPAPL
jgi:hypothetical protein